MARLLTVTEHHLISKGMQADLVRAAEGALLLLPYVHLVPHEPNERDVPCGSLQVELRKPDGIVLGVSGRVLETNLPFGIHCRVLAVDARPGDVPEGTEVWLKE